jgi:uncharacterized membrane protein YfcA
MDILLSLLLGALIGFSLASVGAGGAIIAVPGLVALFNLSAISATTSSLIVVGVSALTGAIMRRQTGINIKLGIQFSLIGVLGTFLGTYLVKLFPETSIYLLFSFLMIVSAITTWRKKPVNESNTKRHNPFTIFLVASSVGILTGLLGIGGGFLIVPALVLFLKVPANVAVGTSLVAITTNTLLALVMRYEHWDQIPITETLTVSLGGALTAIAITPFAKKLPAVVVQKTFAVLLLALSSYLVWQALG